MQTYQNKSNGQIVLYATREVWTEYFGNAVREEIPIWESGKAFWK